MTTIHLHNRGPALWPEAFPEAALKRRRKELGEDHFQAQYQGVPVAGGGAVFREEWLRYYDRRPTLTECLQAWDTAQAGGPGHDFSCGVTGGRGVDGDLYILDVWRGQVNVPTLKAQIVALAARWKPTTILVEEAASGQAVMDILRAERRLPLLGVKPRQSKITRAQRASVHLAEGRVYLPAEAPWLDAFRDELTNFPDVPHDDQVDAFVHLVNAMLGKRQFTHAQASGLRRRPEGW